MDIYFSTDVYRDAADYAAALFPSATVAVVGGGEGLLRACEAIGLKLCGEESESVKEEARAVIITGGEKFIEASRARFASLPTILIPDCAYGSVFDNYIIIGNRIIKCGYPKAIFYDTSKNYGELAASAYAGAFGIYAEITERAMSAVRTPAVMQARTLRQEAWNNLTEERCVEDTILGTASLRERFSDGGTTLIAVARALYSESDGGRPMVSYFMNAYIAVLMAIRFTKFGFCSILLGKDNVRARILAGRLGLPQTNKQKCAFDISRYKLLAERYTPSEAEMREILTRFALEAGDTSGADIQILLDNFILAAGLGEYDGVLGILAQSGFIDAIIDAAI